MQAVIIAGGKGSRLRPFTLKQPKPLIPLLDVPFLEWLVKRCAAAGLTDILVNVGYLGSQIEAFLGSGCQYGVTIRYIREDTPLDTAGAMLLAKPYYTGDPLVVFNADILTGLALPELMAYHRRQQAEHGAVATLTLTRVADITAYGLVETTASGQILAFREKPSPEEAQSISANTINAGTYVLDPQIFEGYPVGDPLSFERQVFPELLKSGAYVSAYIDNSYWRDLGTPHSYYQGQLDILTQVMPDFPLADCRQIQPGIWVHNSAEIHPQAQLNSPCYVGAHCRLGSQAHLPAGTILGSHSWVDGELLPGIYPPGT
ncbi:MAG: NDP-sugar synthase, partial [Thermostichales cyanobacterium HHBFW_bins_127]